MTLRLVPALFLVTATFAPQALAELAPGKVALVSVSGSQASRDDADGLATTLAEQLKGREVLLPEQVRQRLAKRAKTESDRAAQLAKQGRAELQAFQDLERTATLLGSAAETYLKILPSLPSVDEPLRLLVDLSTVTLTLAQSDRTIETLKKAIILDPAFELDPQESPSRLIKAAEQARVQAEGAPLFAVETARQMSKRLAADHLIVCRPFPNAGRFRVEIYLGSSGERDRLFDIEGGNLNEVTTFLTGEEPEEPLTLPTPPVETDPEDPVVFGGDDPPPPRPDPPDGVAERPWYRRWWFWTIVGAVVVGGASAAVTTVLLVGNDADPGLEVMRRW